MRVIKINYPMALAEMGGVRREISLHLLEEGEVKEGDYVVVHVGFAIEKIDEERARASWKTLEEMFGED